MLATTHFVATTSLLLIARQLGMTLTREAIILSYTFGNLIDLDHLFLYPQKSLIAARDFLASKLHRKKFYYQSGKYCLHSYLQEPWFAVIMGLAALILYFIFQNKILILPALALSVHVVMDGLTKFANYLFWPFSKKPFIGWLPSNTLAEYVSSIILSILVIYLSFKTGLFNL